MRLRPIVLALALPVLAPAARADDSAASPAAAATSPVPVVTEPHGLGAQKKVAVALASAGGVSLVLGAIFGGAAIAAWGMAETDCSAGCAPTSAAQTEKSHATSDATVSTVGFIAGGVLVVGGAVVWLTAPASKESTHPGGVALVPGFGGFSLRGSF